MAIKKDGRFEALLYDALSKIPVLIFKGAVDSDKCSYDVVVEQGSDSSVYIKLVSTADFVKPDFFDIVLSPQSLVSIRCDDGRSLSMDEFLRMSYLSASDVSGLAKILKREAKALFGNCQNFPSCIKYLSAESQLM